MATTTDAPVFGQRHRLALAMEYAALSTADMAKQMGRSETTIRNYLKGRTIPDRPALIAWATITDVPFDWLDGPTPSTGWFAGDVKETYQYATRAAYGSPGSRRRGR